MTTNNQHNDGITAPPVLFSPALTLTAAPSSSRASGTKSMFIQLMAAPICVAILPMLPIRFRNAEVLNGLLTYFSISLSIAAHDAGLSSDRSSWTKENIKNFGANLHPIFLSLFQVSAIIILRNAPQDRQNKLRIGAGVGAICGIALILLVMPTSKDNTNFNSLTKFLDLFYLELLFSITALLASAGVVLTAIVLQSQIALREEEVALREAIELRAQQIAAQQIALLEDRINLLEGGGRPTLRP